MPDKNEKYMSLENRRKELLTEMQKCFKLYNKAARSFDKTGELRYNIMEMRLNVTIDEIRDELRIVSKKQRAICGPLPLLAVQFIEEDSEMENST